MVRPPTSGYPPEADREAGSLSLMYHSLVAPALLLPLLLGLQNRPTLDPEFQKVPIDQWLSEPARPGGIRWAAEVHTPALSFHQRLVATFEIKVDGRDLQSRSRNGDLVFYIQVTDSAGNRYQNHGKLELSKLAENVKSIDLQFQVSAFVLPGEYQWAAAFLDTATEEHGARRLPVFRVASPKLDFLRPAWSGLPPVEFQGTEEQPPDSWYLPAVSGRIRWAASVTAPRRLNVILNVAPPPPVEAAGARHHDTTGMAALIPTLRALSETGSPSLSEHIELVDLARRRAAFQQDGTGPLDWSRLKSSLSQANTQSIDVGSLSERHQEAQFFVRQVRKTLTASEQSCVLVILSPPVAFESGEDREPISTEGLPACRVFYVRYRPLPPRPEAEPGFGGLRPNRRVLARGGPSVRTRPEFIVDQLEPTLKPLAPKVFDVETPEQMTRVFVEIEKALSSGG